jgi:hypothetical protein
MKRNLLLSLLLTFAIFNIDLRAEEVFFGSTELFSNFKINIEDDYLVNKALICRLQINKKTYDKISKFLFGDESNYPEGNEFLKQDFKIEKLKEGGFKVSIISEYSNDEKIFNELESLDSYILDKGQEEFAPNSFIMSRRIYDESTITLPSLMKNSGRDDFDDEKYIVFDGARKISLNKVYTYSRKELMNSKLFKMERASSVYSAFLRMNLDFDYEDKSARKKMLKVTKGIAKEFDFLMKQPYLSVKCQ